MLHMKDFQDEEEKEECAASREEQVRVYVLLPSSRGGEMIFRRIPCPCYLNEKMVILARLTVSKAAARKLYSYYNDFYDDYFKYVPRVGYSLPPFEKSNSIKKILDDVLSNSLKAELELQMVLSTGKKLEEIMFEW